MTETYVTIFSSALGQSVLVFILVFTLIFAVLQKSKVLGEGKKQIDALVSLAIALLVISVGYAMNLITKMAPFLSVGLVIILVFLLLTGIFFKGALEFSDRLKAAFGIAAFIAVVIATIVFTGAWDSISSFFSGNSSIVGNVFILIVVILAVWIVLQFGGGSSSGSSKE
jgi:peptidoglycan/LPS O-acetylase OafA/YrhL